MTDTMIAGQATTTTEGQSATPAPATSATVVAETVGATQQADGAKAQEAAQDGSKPASTEGKTPGEAPKVGAPEKYEFKPQEGRAFDAEVMNSFSAIAKELNLPQADAQKMLDAVGPKIAERQMAAIEAVRTQWAESSRSDKEFGGDKLQDNLVVARKAVETFGSPELRTLLNESGLGNHPELIRFMVRAGKAISEDKFVGGSRNGQKTGPKNFNDLASALY